MPVVDEHVRTKDLAGLDSIHPVLSVILDRAKSRSKPGRREDPYKVGLAIEGGTMRGVISGGMVSGLESLGLLNTFDVMYGTSAGAIAGAYLLAGQARYGTTLFYEDINNRQFIDRLRPLSGKPIVDLDFIFEDAIVRRKPLDWQAVISGGIPLKLVAFSVGDLKPKLFSQIESKKQLFKALRASCTLPLAAGPPIEIENDYFLDGGLCEAIPLPSAINDGCTHILVLLTRPLGVRPWKLRIIARHAAPHSRPLI